MRVPGSKSYTHRAYLTAALLAGGEVKYPLRSEDTDATLELLSGLNCEVGSTQKGFSIQRKNNSQISAGRFQVGESGTLLRFLIPVCSVCSGPERVIIQGRGSLQKRSNIEIIDSLRANGFEIEATGPSQTVPLTCYPGQKLPESPVAVSARTTSQFLSGWLLALSAAGGGEIKLNTELVSAPYVTMTENVLRSAGVGISYPQEGHYKVTVSEALLLNYEVPADYSSAAFFIVGAALTDSHLKLSGLQAEDVQADRRIVDILLELGADISWVGDELEIKGPFRPPGFEIDASDCPDLVPILTVLAAQAEGPVKLKNIAHLMNKESDRINMTCRELKKTGLEINPGSDSIEVFPGKSNLKSGPVELESHNDHRLAMSFSILGICRGNVTVKGAESVAKSYPEFYSDLENISNWKRSI